ncbi:hypothetical protein [Nocardia asiatica]|uniref:hypothetical protein n=1 Tax=Nocardia asiatica TaxID=209252 RepID=UPI0012F84A6E|nr:hypothetical protein [Nocardia asiatica]
MTGVEDGNNSEKVKAAKKPQIIFRVSEGLKGALTRKLTWIAEWLDMPPKGAQQQVYETFTQLFLENMYPTSAVPEMLALAPQLKKAGPERDAALARARDLWEQGVRAELAEHDARAAGQEAMELARAAAQEAMEVARRAAEQAGE